MKPSHFSLDHTKPPHFPFPPLQLATYVCLELNDPVNTAWPRTRLTIKHRPFHTEEWPWKHRGYYTLHHCPFCSTFKFLGRELKRLAGSGSPKGNQDHLSMTSPVTRFVSPHPQPRWMSERFILLIKGAMLCLLEKHTEISMEEMMWFTRFASKQYGGVRMCLGGGCSRWGLG